MSTDPIGDMLTMLRNATAARKPVVEVPHSRVKAEVVKILKREGFIADYTTESSGAVRRLRVFLKYGPDQTPLIHGVRRVSRPGRRYYVRAADVPRVRNGLGVAILTTSSGILSDRQARRLRVGGEVICEVW